VRRRDWPGIIVAAWVLPAVGYLVVVAVLIGILMACDYLTYRTRKGCRWLTSRTARTGP
jgi:hypothetical protein